MYRNWASDSNVTKYLTWSAHTSPESTAKLIELWIKEYENPEKYEWAICLEEVGEVIGSISLLEINDRAGRAEAGYCIGRAYWGKGIMTEAFNAVLKFYFEQVGFERVQALHHVDNKASGRVMQKAGLHYEGRLRRYNVTGGGEPADCDLYAMIREDWPGKL